VTDSVAPFRSDTPVRCRDAFHAKALGGYSDTRTCHVPSCERNCCITGRNTSDRPGYLLLLAACCMSPLRHRYCLWLLLWSWLAGGCSSGGSGTCAGQPCAGVAGVSSTSAISCTCPVHAVQSCAHSQVCWHKVLPAAQCGPQARTHLLPLLDTLLLCITLARSSLPRCPRQTNITVHHACHTKCC
jgi:hypothetical protein